MLVPSVMAEKQNVQKHGLMLALIATAGHQRSPSKDLDFAILG